MARKSTIGYWDSREGFFTCHKGKQVLLASGPNDEAQNGPTFRAAQEAFRRLTRSAIFGPTFAEVCEEYLKWHRATHPPQSTGAVADRLHPVVAAFGTCYAAQCRSGDIERWCALQRTERGWGDGTVRLTLQVVSAAFAYAVRDKLLATQPLAPFVLPPAQSRGLDVVLSPAAEVLVLQKSNSALRGLIAVLRDTGCRPGEACKAEARHFNPELRALVLPPTSENGPTHKTGRKTRRARVIYLREESLDVITRAAHDFPHGPLLRTRGRAKTGRFAGQRCPFTPFSVAIAFRLLREKTGIRGLIAYSFRHTFAVRRLNEGWDLNALAEVMGTSVRMLREHYLHLTEQTAYFRGLVDRIG